MTRLLYIITFAVPLFTGCTVISYNRVFPKLTWAWTAEAKEERRERKENEQYEHSLDPNNQPKTK